MIDIQIITIKDELQKEEEKLCKWTKSLSNLRLILFLFIAVLAFFAWKYIQLRVLFGILSGVFFLVFVAVAAVHTKGMEEMEQKKRCLAIIANYEKRADGSWSEFEPDGSSFMDEENADWQDLHLLGRHSVFQFLNISQTKSGQRKLARALTKPPYDETKWEEQQEAIRELKGKFDFCLWFQEVLGRIVSLKNVDLEKNEVFLEHETKQKRSVAGFLMGIFLSVIFDVCIVLFFCRIVPALTVGLMLIICLTYQYLYAQKNREEYQKISCFTKIFGRFTEVYRQTQRQTFQSKKLQNLRKEIQTGYVMIQNIDKLAALYRCMENWLSYLLFNPLFAWNTLVLFVYRGLVHRELTGLRKSVAAMEELEKDIALTGIGWVKKNICMPVLVPKVRLAVHEIRHPLLPEDKCVPNDFSCNENILIITGSNMSGKTSFMRTVGINLALMYAGTFVNARAFQAPFMQIVTSIGVQDDISKGISTFYGELLRIRNILKKADENVVPLMVFIDEIFKGTNYSDRIFGAKAVVDRLAKIEGISMITTHDFELCEIDNPRIQNFHFMEAYEKDKIVFDYKIKPGRCTSTNARYLMGQMGLL